MGLYKLHTFYSFSCRSSSETGHSRQPRGADRHHRPLCHLPHAAAVGVACGQVTGQILHYCVYLF